MYLWFLSALVSLPLAGLETQESKNELELRRDCEIGKAEACRALAARYAYEAPSDLIRAQRWLDAGCQLGDLVACHEAANRVRDGWGAPPDLAVAMSAYEDNCEAGFGASCRELARMYRWGMRLPWDAERAMRFAARGCDSGDGESCWILGDMLLRGEGDSVDAVRGRELVDLGCERGYRVACVHRGVLRSLETGVPVRDPHPGFLVQLNSLDPSSRSYAIDGLVESIQFAHRDRTPKALPYLARALSDPDYYARQSALVAIGHIGPPADPEARDALGSLVAEVAEATDNGWGRRRLVAATLRDYPGNVATLVELLSDDDGDTRQEAASSLARLGASARDATSALEAALRDRYPPAAAWAAIALFRIDPGVAGPALPLLRTAAWQEDTETNTRIEAAEALVGLRAELDGTKALERIWKKLERFDPEKLHLLEAVARIGPPARRMKGLLEDAVEDTSESVRVAAGRALVAAVGEPAYSTLTRVRDKERSWARHAEDVPESWATMDETRKIVTLEAMSAMGRGADPGKNIPRLLAALRDLRTIERPTMDVPNIVWPAKVAGGALVGYGARSVEALAYVFDNDPPPANMNAANALASIGGRRALDVLANALGDEDRSLMAAMALAAAGDRRGLDRLIEHLGSSDEWYSVVASLEKIPDERAVGALLELLETRATPNTLGESVIVKTLAAIGSPRGVPALFTVAQGWADGRANAWDAASGIAQAGEPAFHAMRRSLRATDARERRAAAFTHQLFGRMDDSRGLDELVRVAIEDEDQEVSNEAIRALAQTRHPRWLSDAWSPLIDEPRTRKQAANALGFSLDPREPADNQAMDSLLEALTTERDEDVLNAVLGALHRLSDATRDVDAWRAWWSEQRPAWRARRAFQRRRVRVRGKIVDEAGEPMPDLQIILSHVNREGHYSPRRRFLPGGTSTCRSDEHGALVYVYEREELMNPFAATGPDGKFEMGDWRQFVGAGEDYTVFVSTTAGCQRLLTADRPVEFHVGLDTDVVELGEMSLAPDGR